MGDRLNGARACRGRRYGECVALVDAYTPNDHDTLNANGELTSANHATCAVGEGEGVPWATA